MLRQGHEKQRIKGCTNAQFVPPAGPTALANNYATLSGITGPLGAHHVHCSTQPGLASHVGRSSRGAFFNTCHDTHETPIVTRQQTCAACCSRCGVPSAFYRAVARNACALCMHPKRQCDVAGYSPAPLPCRHDALRRLCTCVSRPSGTAHVIPDASTIVAPSMAAARPMHMRLSAPSHSLIGLQRVLRPVPNGLAEVCVFAKCGVTEALCAVVCLGILPLGHRLRLHGDRYVL